MKIILETSEVQKIKYFLKYCNDQVKQLAKDIEITINPDLRNLLISQRDQVVGMMSGFDKAFSILGIDYSIL